MKLLIDAGNTRIKWQLRDGADVRLAGSGILESESTFRGIARAQWQAIACVSVSTVRSERARQQLESVIAGYTAAPVRFLWTQASFGPLQCAYQDPSTMGADRWHALVGAWHLVQGACAVVDAGSAITIDWVDAKGRHLGGYILPGRSMMTVALKQSTARVLFDEQDAEGVAPGRSTSECVFHGRNWMIQALARQLGRELVVPLLITGGDGALIKKALDEDNCDGNQDVRLCPDLVLEGLALAEAS